MLPWTRKYFCVIKNRLVFDHLQLLEIQQNHLIVFKLLKGASSTRFVGLSFGMSVGQSVCLSVGLSVGRSIGRSVGRSLTTSQNSHYWHSFYSILVLQYNVMMHDNTLAIQQLYSCDSSIIAAIAALQIAMLVGRSVGNHKLKQSLYYYSFNSKVLSKLCMTVFWLQY